MATTTPTLQLVKPDRRESASVLVFNQNMDKIDEAFGNLDDFIDGVIDKIYPVGSIYMSVNNVSPETLLEGTTWVRLKDRFLMGAGDTYAAGDTGGSATHTLTVDEMPSHNHSFTGSAVNTGNQSAGHTHSTTDYYATNPSGTAISVAQMPSHSHNVLIGSYNAIFWGNSYQSGSNRGGVNFNETAYLDMTTDGRGSSNSHAHTGNNASTSRTSGGISANHTHSVTATGTIGNKGSGNAFSIMPPYLAVYMWKRTA